MARGERGIGMEGWLARSYERTTRKYMNAFRSLADEIAAFLPSGSAVLEVAPGPGFLAVELARRGLKVTTLDISKTFVKLVRDKASAAGVIVDSVRGNVSEMPFANASFDFLVCRAAFKNFSDPVDALREMSRVLKPGAKGLIIDLRRDASLSDIVATAYAKSNVLEKLAGRLVFTFLRRRAYTSAEMNAMLAQTPLSKSSIRTDVMGMDVNFER